MANATWNPSDISANVTLSGGNLTATATASNTWVRAPKQLASSGKFYFELQAMTWGWGNTEFGFCSSTLSSPNGASSAGMCGVQTPGSGNVYNGTTYTGVSLGGSGGSTYCFAVDLNAQLAWIRLAPSGNWNGSGTANPSTGVGGMSVSAISGTDACPLTAFGGNGEAVVANFGDSAFSGVVPGGFTAGWPGAAVAGSAQARAMVLA
jgi:hypothetical protein